MTASTRPSPEPCSNPPPEAPLPDPRIEIFKSKRELRLYSKDTLVAAYPVVIGRNPVEDKQREGDHCTPEGHFYVCMRNPESRYHLSLGLSYPNAEDAARGLREGLLSRPEHDRIVAAIERRECPNWYTALGGEICIHGRGEAKGWTAGCIALRDEAMDELFRAVPLRAPVRIRP